MQTLTELLNQFKPIIGDVSRLEEELHKHFSIKRKCRHRPVNRYYKGERLVWDNGLWKWGKYEEKSLTSIKFRVSCEQALKGGTKHVIKRPEFAPYYIKISENNISVYEDRNTYQVNKVAYAGSLDNALKNVQRLLLSKGIILKKKDLRI